MMKSITTIFAIAFLLTQISGCASVLRGTAQVMTFRSEPEGATVFVDGLEKGKTPLTVKLRKDEYKKITFKKSGYRDRDVLLNTKFDKIGWINVVFPYWFTTDALTGAMFAYVPGKYIINLEKLPGSKQGDKASLDRLKEGEAKDFILQHYTRLKQQCQIACDNEHMQTLSWLLALEYQQDIKFTNERVVKALANTNDPMVFMQRLEAELRHVNDVPQSVALKATL